MQNLGKYSLAALTPELIAKYRDDRLAGLHRKDAKGKPVPKPRSPNTVRLDLALLGHLFNVTIKEWGIGLTYNPVQSIRRPAPSPGRDRRLTREEEIRLMALADAADEVGKCWPRVRLITEKCCASERTVQRVLKELEERGFLHIERRFRGDEGQSSNAYYLCFESPFVNLSPPSLAPTDKLTPAGLPA